MKRHTSLAKLSREHHGALILARLLQNNAPAYKTLPTDIEGKAQYALQFYKQEMINHFEEEEKAMQLAFGINPALDLLVATIIREHQELHQLFKSIPGQHDLPTYLDGLGKALEIHVRKEERELFPLIQQCCNEKQLAAIGNSLCAH